MINAWKSSHMRRTMNIHVKVGTIFHIYLLTFHVTTLFTTATVFFVKKQSTTISYEGYWQQSVWHVWAFVELGQKLTGVMKIVQDILFRQTWQQNYSHARWRHRICFCIKEHCLRIPERETPNPFVVFMFCLWYYYTFCELKADILLNVEYYNSDLLLC